MIQIPCLNKEEIETLIFSAVQVALRFSCPVFLVGSAVDSAFPNDIDIYCAIKGDAYLRLFTNYGRKSQSDDHMENCRMMKIQMAKIYKKQKEYFESKIKGWDFDVKFQIIDQFMKHEGKRIRLDSVYEGVW